MDTALLSSLGLLNCLVFKRLGAGEFELIYNQAAWKDEWLPSNAQIVKFENEAGYLEDFLIDAENLWRNQAFGKIKSGIWSEQTSKQTLRLEASAIATELDNYLVIDNVSAKYMDKQETLQIARELAFSQEQITSQHQYINARLDQILCDSHDLTRSQNPVNLLLNQTELGVLILDQHLAKVGCNSVLIELFSELNNASNNHIEQQILTLFSSQYPECERILSTQTAWTGELFFLNAQNENKWIKLSLHPIKNQSMELQNWIVVVSDVTQIKYLQKRNEKLTHFDDLTGLPNRQHFWHKLSHSIQIGLPFYLLYIDIKQFQRINEIHGYQEGDSLIKELSKRLKSTLSEQDILARIGGTEFALIKTISPAASQTADKHQAECTELAQSLIDITSIPVYMPSGKSCELALNIGAAAFPDDGQSAEELMKFADLAVFSAKKVNHSNIQFYSKALVEASRKRIEMEEALQEAIINNEFELHLQPIMYLDTDQVHKAEVLIRWRQADGKLISPDEFIPLAEQTGLIIPIGKWVIAQACYIFTQLNQLGNPITLSINLSPRQVKDRGLFEFIKKHLQEQNIDPKYIEFELTEGVLIDDYQKVYELLDELRKLGISVSIDDFGTGFSSLSYLQKLPIDRLKIDRAFISQLSESSQSSASALIVAIISMAQSLNMEVIAEGVETQVQKEFLQNNQCNIAQGYLFSRPLPVQDFYQLIQQNPKN
ncbi:EAL domain-containing protein [Paraglaciecola aestuariivivens]